MDPIQTYVKALSSALKDRKGRVLDIDDLNHYRQVVAALGDTIRLMDDVDEAIEKGGGWPLK